MNEGAAVGLILVALVAAPALIGSIVGRRIAGLRGRLIGGGLPVVLWTAYILRELSLPRDYDYGPEPAVLLKQWIVAVTIAGCVGALAAANCDLKRQVRRAGA